MTLTPPKEMEMVTYFKSVGNELFNAQCHSFEDIFREVSKDTEVRLCGHKFVGYDPLPWIELDGVCYSLSELEESPNLVFSDDLICVKIDPKLHQIVGTMGDYYVKFSYNINFITGKQFVMLLNRMLNLLFNSNFNESKCNGSRCLQQK